jgi:antirestriction protein ArdC
MTKANEKMRQAADQVIALMESEGTNWVKPWTSHGAPHNVVTGKAYRGSNLFFLGLASHVKGYESNSWATFKQWADLGASVKKGEKSTSIFFFSVLEKQDAKTKEKNSFGFWKTYSVFNADQVEGYEAKTKDKPELSPIASAELFVSNTQASITHEGDRACYIPALDQIKMPNFQAFTGEGEYYSTLLHELTHWTGHASRLDRGKGNSFGSEDYAREELVAECGAALLCVLLGIEKEPTPNHARYLNSWIQAIKDDHKAIFSAMSQAQKAIDYLEGLQSAEQLLAAE